MAKTISDLWKSAESLKQEGEDVANYKGAVASLPSLLKDEFRKKQDPKLDEQINRLQDQTFGAAIKGLNMYQDISNPFARRDLAEQYQGGIAKQWQNATDERTRRQGVYSDYIEKWTGLYGAEAAKRQDIFNNKMTVWNMEKNLADTEESNRRWEITNARAGSGSQKDTFLKDAQDQLDASRGEDGKVDPNVYEKIRNLAWSNAGITKENFDSQYKNQLGEHEYGTVNINKQEVDYKAKNEQKVQKNVYELIDNAKKTEKEAGEGENYWGTDGKIYKKKSSYFGSNELVYDPSSK